MTLDRAAAIGAAALLFAASACAESGACDRACLEGLLDSYVDAVVAHDAARLPLTADAKFTRTLPDGRRVESGPKIPWTWAIAEVFKIDAGLIGPVESVLHQVPYGMGSGWSTWEQSLSSEPRG